MAIRNSKTTKLYYIEETPKQHIQLRRVAKASVKRKIQLAKKNGFYVTYTKGSEIVREYPNGEITIIGTLNSQSLKVERGAKYTLSEGA